MRKTKIICTLGPSTDKGDVLRDLIANGMNVARFNFSHGSYEEHGGRLAKLKALREELGKPVAALLDTKGPEIRLKEFKNGVEMLEAGQTFTLTTREVEGTKEICSVTYKDLPQDVQPGGTIMLDDGLIMLHIEQVTDTDIICTVLNSGKIKTKKGVNVPGVHLSMPYLSQKDREDIIFGVQNGFDFIAASFVRTAQDVYDIRNLLNEYDSNIRIIAKIENREGVNNIDSILSAADAVMVARGDLGIEVSIEELPIIQRRIIRHCHRLGRRCIVATHMLESMITQPTPTRAEVTDVSNAIFEQADAVMLSGETSVGHYPVRCVEVLDSIAQRMERSGNLNFAAAAILNGDRQKATKAAISLADSVENACLIVFTRRGLAATQAAVLRPERAPIYAFSNDPVVVRQLALARDVTAFESPFLKDPARMISTALDLLKEKGLVTSGQPVIIQGDSLQGELLADSIIFMRTE